MEVSLGSRSKKLCLKVATGMCPKSAAERMCRYRRATAGEKDASGEVSEEVGRCSGASES